ncbi:MAG: molecular chaperone TorD family protein [Deltaproteobacteria bacterium]|nr:molecular chaperone TorD family protein [Deltaproteobacteria bacterium]
MAPSRLGVLALNPDAECGFPEFAEFVAGRDLRELEELYTSTFDIQGNVCLDVGYQLFGETYKRGQFIVKLRVALREAGVSEAGELPDHLPSVLRFLARRDEEEEKTQRKDAEAQSENVCAAAPSRLGDLALNPDSRSQRYPGDAEELVREAVLPAIVKMIDAFGVASNPYRALLEATKAVLQADYGVAEIPAAPDADRGGSKSFLPPGASGRFTLPIAQDYDVDEEGSEQRGFRP